MLPPYSAIGTCIVEIYGPSPGHSRWGDPSQTWGTAGAGTARWSGQSWQNVTPQSMNAKTSWGADEGSQGVLAVAAAGTWNISTYDPDRKLDPSNPASPWSSVLHPGSPVRIRYVGGVTRTVKMGAIDTISYSLQTEMGSIRATDGTAKLNAAKIAAATGGAPATLRARARWALGIAKITDITVEADPVEGDPTVGGTIAEEATVWTWLITSAFDVLHAVWLDQDNVIRFRAFGSPRDLGLDIGATGIPLADINPGSTMDGVYSRIIGYDVGAPSVKVIATDVDAQQSQGDSYLERTRPVPNAAGWVASVLADRSGAALQYDLGTLRPRTEAELVALLDTGMVDVAHVLVQTRDDGREVLTQPIEAAPRVLGGTFEANTRSGWSAHLVTYIPAQEWQQSEVPAPPPPAPPPATQTVTRTYVVTKDSRAARTSGGSNYGSGTEHELPVGAGSGWRNRAFLAFATIPWGDVISVVSAELRVFTTTQVNVGFGSSPKVRVRRVTAGWSEGSASSPSGSNALVYPGPGMTSTGETVQSVTGSQSTLVIIPITTIAKAWAPAAAGGSGLANYGLAIVSYAEDDTSRTTEFSAREAGSSVDAEIRITVKIPA